MVSTNFDNFQEKCLAFYTFTREIEIKAKIWESIYFLAHTQPDSYIFRLHCSTWDKNNFLAGKFKWLSQCHCKSIELLKNKLRQCWFLSNSDTISWQKQEKFFLKIPCLKNTMVMVWLRSGEQHSYEWTAQLNMCNRYPNVDQLTWRESIIWSSSASAKVQVGLEVVLATIHS